MFTSSRFAHVSRSVRYAMVAVAAFVLGSATVASAATGGFPIGSLFYIPMINGVATTPCNSSTTSHGVTTTCNAVVDSMGNLSTSDAGTHAALAKNQYDGAGNLRVTSQGATTVSGSVSVNNLPAVQAVSGSVGVNNFPATQAVSGTVTVGNLPTALSSSDSTVELGSGQQSFTAPQQNVVLASGIDVSPYKEIRVYIECYGTSLCSSVGIYLGDFTGCVCPLDDYILTDGSSHRTYTTPGTSLFIGAHNTSDNMFIKWRVVGRRN